MRHVGVLESPVDATHDFQPNQDTWKYERDVYYSVDAKTYTETVSSEQVVTVQQYEIEIQDTGEPIHDTWRLRDSDRNEIYQFLAVWNEPRRIRVVASKYSGGASVGTIPHSNG
jgi:hypothetical protein